MASKADQLLIVVSILEGRHFPKSLRLSLVVQASFDGEQLSTDPTEHRDQPQFNTELAWELDRKTLHQHRLQRTPIKLQCYAIDPATAKKENVGYIILDLRSVHEARQDPRWYPLLSSKYTKQRPELLLSLLLENDNKPSEPSPDRFKAKKAPPRQGSSAVTDLLPGHMEAMLIADQGYYQVGPADYCTDMFLLSVTLAFATKLEQLIPSTMKMSSEDSEFFFYYTLLGNDITSEPFRNLLSPDFEPERASVRIRSSKQVLQTFLSQQPRLQIHLCCGSQSLGSTSVFLSALSSVSVDLESKPAMVEGAFILQPTQRTNKTFPDDLQPTVGISVSLRREEVTQQSTSKAAHGALKLSNPPPAVTSSLPAVRPTPRSSSPVRKTLDSSPPVRFQSPPDCHTESEMESLLEEPQRVKEPKGSADLQAPAQQQQQQQNHVRDDGASSVTVSAPKVSVPSSGHHYCFSLDLCSLGGLKLKHSISATLRYTYQFFGSSAPIMTNPPVELHRGREVSLPQSYCAFDFVALPQQLQDTFLRVPLVVEVWHRDSNSRDQLIGEASIPLSPLLSSDKTKFHASTGEQGWRGTHQDRIPVLSLHHEKVAELSYVATLEDLGLIKAREVIVSDSSYNEAPACTQTPSRQATLAPAGSNQKAAPPGLSATRDTLEYRTALELELWKEEQEELFGDQLKKKEMSYMQTLAEQWKKRDREREALLKKKEVDYNLLEEKLHKTLTDLGRREKELGVAEQETQRLQRELKAKYDLAHRELKAERDLGQRELQESSRRMQQECDHRVALQKDKIRLMEEERARLLRQITDGEARYKQLEKEFQAYREQQSIRPEVRLQSEINLLTLQKGELERKLESCTKSKLHYKQQWGRALKELARIKQREQESAMIRLKKQQAELEALKLRYLATEKKEAFQQDKQELEDVKNELNRLKKLEEDRLGPTSGKNNHAAQSRPVNESADDHLSRLFEERDLLLRTGVYTHEDRIIAELNRQIQEAMSGRDDGVGGDGDA